MSKNEIPSSTTIPTAEEDGFDSIDDFPEDFDELKVPEHRSLYEGEKTAKDRVDVIRRIRALLPGLPSKDDELDEIERLERQASNNRFYPTLGIEVEVHERYDEEKSKLFAETGKAGLPHDYEPGVWEYAHGPVHHYRVLVEEEKALIELGLVNDDRGHPMHLTVGGIESEIPLHNSLTAKYYLRDAFVLGRALEATGWSCSGRRLRAPDSKDASWDAKTGGSVEGILQRYDDQNPPQGFAVEYRPLELNYIDGLEKTLEAAYYLGAALKATQKHGETKTDLDLSDSWETFAQEMGEIFKRYGMDDPRTTSWKVRRQGYEYEDDSEEHNFEILAELLGQWEDQEGEGVEFVTKVQELVQKYCDKIKNTIPDIVVSD
jgi:hypothetical protein